MTVVSHIIKCTDGKYYYSDSMRLSYIKRKTMYRIVFMPEKKLVLELVVN